MLEQGNHTYVFNVWHDWGKEQHWIKEILIN